MCTLVAFHRIWDDLPLVVAVNRDEAYDRPSAPPAWIDRDPAVLLPRDERAGGTWMGATAAGLWVGLTNRRGAERPDRRSRGLLTLELLKAADPAAVVERIERLDRPYNPFNLVAGDGRSLAVVEYEGERARTRWLEPGCHLVTNRPLDETAAEPKAIRVRSLLAEAGLDEAATGAPGPAPAGLVAALAAILADHGRVGRDAVCLHGGGYGTRSAAVWRFGPPGGPPSARVRLAFADGPPCSAPFEEVADSAAG